MRRLLLIGCVASKASTPMHARDLYQSQLFRARRDYADAAGRPWAIVSAHEMAIIEPNQLMEPYDRRIDCLSDAELERWCVMLQVNAYALFGEQLRGATVEVHAGKHYVDAVTRSLRGYGVTITAPLRGLAIGKQLQWYAQRRAAA